MPRRFVFPAAAAIALVGTALLVAGQIHADAVPPVSSSPVVTPTHTVSVAPTVHQATPTEVPTVQQSKAPVARGTEVPVAQGTTVPVNAPQQEAIQVRPEIRVKYHDDSATVTVSNYANATTLHVSYGWGVGLGEAEFPLVGDPAVIRVPERTMGMHFVLEDAQGQEVASHRALVQPGQERVRAP